MRVALVHYWIVNWRGGEKVLEALADLFPDADIYTHVYDPELVKASKLAGRNIRTSFIQRLPWAKKLYQRYLPFMPLALEQLDFSGYDLVISSESGPTKGVIVPPGTAHVCYCHTPMRYVWDMYHDYLAHSSWLTRMLMRPLMHYLRLWDRLSADRVDLFIANSNFVKQRIAKFYRRDAEVVHPPINLDEFRVSSRNEGFYLVVGALVRYKRADLAVRAFNRLGLPLVILGDGELFRELKDLAGSNVKVLGRQPWAVIRDHYEKCKALIFPGVEDFGLVPLEAMACGKPVIAFSRGGALETVRDGVTGLYFHEQTEEALIDAIARLESSETQFDPAAIRAHVEQFDVEHFNRRIGSILREKVGLSLPERRNETNER